MKRQEMFCSNLVHYSWNVKMEDELLNFAAQLKVVDGLRDIFKNDRSCAEYLNTDPRRNGCLMWLYLRYWQLQVTLQTHQRAEAAVLGPQTKEWESRTESMSLKWCVLKDLVINKVNEIQFSVLSVSLWEEQIQICTYSKCQYDVHNKIPNI